MTSVLVTNIAPGTSESTITEFFGFCGRIANIRLEDGEQSMTAHITFETSTAANTSLLLANALIADRPIQVALVAGDEKANQEKKEAAEEEHNAQQQLTEEQAAGGSADEAGKPLLGEGAERAEPNAATRVIAQLLAAGHKLGDGAMERAKALDEEWQVSAKVQAGLEEVKEALSGLSERMGLTQKTQEAVQTVQEKAAATGITEKASQAVAATEDFFTNLARQASSTIQSVAQSGAQWAEQNMPGTVAKLREAGTAVGQQAEAIRAEAHQIYAGAPPAEDPAAVPEDDKHVASESPATATAQ